MWTLEYRIAQNRRADGYQRCTRPSFDLSSPPLLWYFFFPLKERCSIHEGGRVTGQQVLRDASVDKAPSTLTRLGFFLPAYRRRTRRDKAKGPLMRSETTVLRWKDVSEWADNV